jgi:hypothetical protein
MREDYTTSVHQWSETPIAPEQRICDMLREDLNLTVHPQALRMFVRTRWARLSKAAHEIHDGK